MTLVLTNVSVGYLSTAKKSSDRRCASRSGVLVSMLAAWIVKVTDDRAGCSSSNSMAPSKSAKRPRTFEMRWRTWNAASEWVLSMAYVRVVVAIMCVLLWSLMLV